MIFAFDSGHNSRSFKIKQIPFGCPSEKCIGCLDPSGIISSLNFFLPPGLRFIFDAIKASSAYITWDVALSNANTSISPGCNFSKIGMAFSII
jgi:hypothetical protein